MKNADKYTIENLGVPSDVLVERAGEAVAEEIIRRKKGGRVLVVCGRGNNGADGKVIAKTLSSHHGFSVKIYDVCADDISVLDGDYDIIVDCIFGTGLNRKVDGEYKTVIDKINGKGKYVVSCDIPSGLNADTGVPMGVAVKANLTVAVQEYKTGHFFNDGIDYSGETVAKDIGISIWGEDFSYRLTKEDVCAYFPKRNRNSNKGDYKKACVIGGSESFYGAPLLSSLSLTSLVGGAGYAYLGVPESRYSLYAGINPECIVLPCNGADADKFFFADSIAAGMGKGAREET
ncbi:MAG: bifunctional ADP-dependent NAD(P)H-hydrate dehydratase/NAD(P)H-hydrate epimerase, partial [Clostridia bacterium]|nr:bifunctional ADP-dependent NAD(P)H-hydrate dehydratase/NAD(P)H-hydrate epimerase [Clostridia bacterium]